MVALQEALVVAIVFLNTRTILFASGLRPKFVQTSTLLSSQEMQINDIVERETTSPVKAPAAPRAPVASALKWTARTSQQTKIRPEMQSRAPAASVKRVAPKSTTQHISSVSTPRPDAMSEAEKIHLESVKKLAGTSPEEIEQEKQRLIDSLDPEVLRSLLRRAEIKEQEFGEPKLSAQSQGRQDVADGGPAFNDFNSSPKLEGEIDIETLSRAEPVEHADEQTAAKAFTADHLDKAGEKVTVPVTKGLHAYSADSSDRSLADRTNLHTLSSPSPRSCKPTDEKNLHASIHFPPPPEELRAFFPQLPVESEKMAWMEPVAEEEEAEYSSQLGSLLPSQLRFDFNGNLIPPRLASSISPSAGLHHHGDAPAAAGYTIPELARLCRSTFPAQRSSAMQTLGRILYRLKTNAFHKSTDLQYGLEQLFQHERILQLLYDAASDQTRNLTVKTVATEALWLLSQAGFEATK